MRKLNLYAAVIGLSWIFCGCDKIPEVLNRIGIRKYSAEHGKVEMISDSGIQLKMVYGSPEVKVDGVPVILPEKIQPDGNKDWERYLPLVENILAPLLNHDRKCIRKIVIDPGHGGKDSGARAVNGVLEKDLNLQLALALREKLVSVGYQVIMTRDRDVFITLDRRAEIANECAAEFFISIHHNSSATNANASGMEIFVINPDDHGEWRRCAASVFPAWMIQKEQAGVNGSFGRGVKFARFKVLRLVKSPALLIENAFLSNREDAIKSASESHRQLVSAAITRALLGSFPVAGSRAGGR